jgi:hypothetical protein
MKLAPESYNFLQNQKQLSLKKVSKLNYDYYDCDHDCDGGSNFDIDDMW